MQPWWNREWDRVLMVLDLKWRAMPRLSPTAPSRVSRKAANALSRNRRSRRRTLDRHGIEGHLKQLVVGYVGAGDGEIDLPPLWRTPQQARYDPSGGDGGRVFDGHSRMSLRPRRCVW